MHIEEGIPNDADLVIDTKIVIRPGSLIPTCLISSHVAFVSAFDDALPPNTRCGFDLLRESNQSTISCHDFLAVEALAFTRDVEVSSERSEVPPSDSVGSPDSGSDGVTLLGP